MPGKKEMRKGWRTEKKLLHSNHSMGTSTLWFAFHGAGEIHDRAVLHKGAYCKSLRAVELALEAGMQAGCNLFLTKENIGQFDQLVADLQHAGINTHQPKPPMSPA